MEDAPNARTVKQEKAAHISKLLQQLYPDARCTLHYQNVFQLLVATMLSAQCTDARVNTVTPLFFQQFPTPHAVAQASVEALEACIQPIGLFRAKARNLKNACRMLVADYGGKVPRTLKDLLRLPGVGRKTAHVILGNAFGVPALPVDTHAARVSQRLGLTRHRDPNKIEKDLCALYPPELWVRLSHQLIQHGRQVCRSQRPLCASCALKSYCEAYLQGRFS